MVGIGFWELVLVLIIAMVVINPKDIPKIAYTIGIFFAKCSNMLQNLKNQYLQTFTNEK